MSCLVKHISSDLNRRENQDSKQLAPPIPNAQQLANPNNHPAVSLQQAGRHKLIAPRQSGHAANYQQDASSQFAIAAVAQSIAKKTASLDAEKRRMEKLMAGIEPDLDIWNIPAAPHLLARQLEKKQARLTGDKEERHALRTSIAIKAEERSEDDEDEVKPSPVKPKPTMRPRKKKDDDDDDDDD
jgi:hypothetical protein